MSISKPKIWAIPNPIAVIKTEIALWKWAFTEAREGYPGLENPLSPTSWQSREHYISQMLTLCIAAAALLLIS